LFTPYIKVNPWKIIEEGFKPELHEISESLCSIGNGHMGQRAMFEETYSGHTLQGSYMAGVYYPDKTRVGWWKNGYPEYFAKVLNSTNWIGLKVVIDGIELDLAHVPVREFVRELNMKEGYLYRTFVATLPGGKEVKIEATRFVSIVEKEAGLVRYAITPLNFSGVVEVVAFLDADVKNKDSNYDEKFWDAVAEDAGEQYGSVQVKTKKLDFQICSHMVVDVQVNGQTVNAFKGAEKSPKKSHNTFEVSVGQGQTATIYKYVGNVTNRDHEVAKLAEIAKQVAEAAKAKGFERMLADQATAWANKWKDSDIVIEGDDAAQQGIRFNIYHMNQTYTGEDARLNIGPKGFTGEKYGGSTYWDTEAYCLPFYLGTADEAISRQLLVYRHNHLERAKENARKLGFTKGALYPMVTMNGEECHNEWEITFEEIHRNGAIAYGIYNYVNYTGDYSYLGQLGVDVLVEISRFWELRVHHVPAKNVYMMHGVTGPNEYENNVNNNWYTNRIASWTLEYTLDVIAYLKENEAERYAELAKNLGITEEETVKWQDIIDNMYYPVDEKMGIFLQQDNFLDKEIIKVADLDRANLPLNQKWSWDRILRSCYIKQADVLQGLYFFGDQYDTATLRRNFDFYEPLTVHESSLSPCVHSILACELGYQEKAYEMYLRTSRLDLDNYNNDTEDGLHITSMAGTWMSVIQGFGGMKVVDGVLQLKPFIPGQWKSFGFKIVFRGARLQVNVTSAQTTLTNESAVSVLVRVGNKEFEVAGGATISA
jgi:maltose phosphorylase